MSLRGFQDLKGFIQGLTGQSVTQSGAKEQIFLSPYQASVSILSEAVKNQTSKQLEFQEL